MDSKRILILGGGLAGLSSALTLAEAGYRVELVERKPHLGGRAASYLLPDGEHVDNCQHVTMGCCTNLEDFYRRVGAAGKIRYYDHVAFLDREGRRSVLESSVLPPPLHLAPSFLMLPFLSWKDKRGIGRAMLRIARRGGQGGAGKNSDSATMLEWLRGEGQTPAAIERVWKSVLVSALDEELDRAGARYGVEVFWKAFLRNRRGFEIGIPSVPLGELYGGCREAIERRGGSVRTRTAVRGLRLESGRVAAAVLDDGTELTADYFVSAVPHDLLLELLPAEVVTGEKTFAALRELRSSPITGVHLWLDRVVTEEPYLALLDRTTQWIFNKTKLYGANGAGNQYLQLVVSASYDLVEKSRQEIVEMCWCEVQESLPAAREAQLIKATVVKEVAATFSPAPGCDRLRPGARSPLSNLYLAGDWTATGWPATMESAVRSGYKAAEVILANDGRAQAFLCDDLRAEGLTKRWEN
ncbi:MAG TPA: hydroxysqualene dehydroxylase HpnE [Candidatus Acidoferrales bacterium]|nr:hydroxysqualene dehydroxylase HpnE [Candidatus Acidoferrales bacterium]